MNKQVSFVIGAIAVISILLFLVYKQWSSQSEALTQIQSSVNVASDLPMGDTSTTQCRELIKEENDHANSVFKADGADKFIETISDQKYLYSKKLCLASMERIQRYPEHQSDTFDFWIQDMATGDIISELSFDENNTSSTSMWYMNQPTTDSSKSPTSVWAQIQKLQ
jgi:hypothetical protein